MFAKTNIKGVDIMRIKNIKKFVRSILIILGIAVIITLLISRVTLSHNEVEYKTIYVSKGDTLWNIAKSNQANNEYYKNKDVRFIINDLIKINNLDSSDIEVNQELMIPVV